MWDQRRVGTPRLSTPRVSMPSTPRQVASLNSATPARTPVWRGPSLNESRQPWQSQPLTPSKSRPYTAPLADTMRGRGGPQIFRLPPGQRSPGHQHSPGGGSLAARRRLPLPSAASHRDIVQLRSRHSFPGPIRLQTPLAELRALDGEAYDRREGTSPTGAAGRTGTSARRARSAARRGAARSIAVGDGRAAPVAVAASASAGAAPPAVVIDPQAQAQLQLQLQLRELRELRELQELARALTWSCTGAPGARTSRGRYALTEILKLSTTEWTLNR